MLHLDDRKHCAFRSDPRLDQKTDLAVTMMPSIVRNPVLDRPKALSPGDLCRTILVQDFPHVARGCHEVPSVALLVSACFVVMCRLRMWSACLVTISSLTSWERTASGMRMR